MNYADTLKLARARAHWQREQRVRWEFERLTGFPRPPRHEREHKVFRDFAVRGWMVCVGWTDAKPAAPIYDTCHDDDE